MEPQKQPVNFNFSQGLDRKTDPFQVQLGRFLELENSVFQVGGLLQKRNGFGFLTSLPDATSTYLTTFNGGLTAIGEALFSYSAGSSQWINAGSFQPLSLRTLPLIRNNLNQTQCDSVVSGNGLVCTAFSQSDGSTTTYLYAIADVTTGQNVVPPTLIPAASSGTITGSPRVFLLGPWFIIVFTNVISATSHLQYLAIPTANPIATPTTGEIASSYVSATTLSWDGIVANNKLFVSWNTTTGGQAIKIASLSVTLTLAAPSTFTSSIATVMSLSADVTSSSNPTIWISFYDAAGSTGHVIAVDQNLNTILAATAIISSGTVINVTSAAQNGSVTVYYEIPNSYSYDSGIPTNLIASKSVTQSGSVMDSGTVVRSVGLASKAFIIDGTEYFLAAYESPFQPTYFLINGSLSTETAPIVVSRLAYQNGGGYLTVGLPSVSVTGNTAQVAYLLKDLIAAVNKGTALSTGTQTAGIYSQTGINLATFAIGSEQLDTAETAQNLLLTGGFLWGYDGYKATENNFFLYPDSIEATWNASGGSIAAQPDGTTNTNAYWIQVTYEWSDNQGNLFRSAPSIPIPVTTTGSGSSGSIVVTGPTCRLTYKTGNPVKIVIYRWSVSQQVYYQTTSILSPQLNSLSTDSFSFTDINSDATILGNNILYTTGGVVEDVGAPASDLVTLFDDRLWLVDSEDRNLLWFSKQVIEATPLEMSDLFTMYIAPTIGAQGSTGEISAIGPMDDKLVIFKKNAAYYINGTGPDNTGINNNYSQPTFITSTAGCSNQKSIVFTPQGLMFQSNGKGIWLLGRDLTMSYIGAAVEAFNSAVVTSAVNVPETNQVRFTLDSGITLMYDYYYGQWGTFVGVPAISSTLYEDLHTCINSLGQVLQETPGQYLDGTNPVLMSFKTAWLQLAGLQGYQRAYFFYLLGTYLSPHKLFMQIAYDYALGPTQSFVITPDNFAPIWGALPTWGDPTQGPWGGQPSLEDWKINLKRQRCRSFQISLQEMYDPSLGVPAGAGLTISGIDCVIGIKKGYYPIRASRSIG